MPRRGMVAGSRWMGPDHSRTPSSFGEVAGGDSDEAAAKKQGDVGGAPRPQARTLASTSGTSFPRGVSRSRAETCCPARRGVASVWGRHWARGNDDTRVPHRFTPLTEQVSQCEQFIARAQKRLVAHDEERTLLVKQLGDGQQRLQSLREQVSQSAAPVQPPPDWGAQVASLQQMVNALQSERDALAAQIHAEMADMSRRTGQQGAGQAKNIPAMPPLVPGELSQWMGDGQADLKNAFADEDDVWVFRIDFEDGEGGRTVDPVDASVGNVRRRDCVAGSAWRGAVCPILSVLSVLLCLKRLVSSRVFVVRSPRYGVRGCGVGEASNPGPRVRRRRRVLSSVSRQQFLHFVGRNGGRSQCGSDSASIFRSHSRGAAGWDHRRFARS